MLAISQSGATYNYLNWIPSESGPLVTHHGSIQKELENPHGLYEHYHEIIEGIFSIVQQGDLICTFSLDSSNLLFSTCNAVNNSEEMIQWHLNQAVDEELKKVLEFYHYPINSESGKILNIGIPKNIRKSLQTNMSLLKSKMNGLSVGIFSAEVGARQWMHANQNQRYLIWKIGKKKNDEMLYIQNGELISYFSFHRSAKKNKLNWQFGDYKFAELIVEEVTQIKNNTSNKREIKRFGLQSCRNY